VNIQKVCVYCGSSPGRLLDYMRAASELGSEIGKRGFTLVYGGASTGLMGEVARAVINIGGKVIGVIPQALAEQEIAFEELAELRVVRDMHERKTVMSDLADCFIALPGGFGTIEEFFETLTWLQLGIHSKPCGLLNVNGYFDQLLLFLDHAVGELFIHKPHLELMMVSDRPSQLLDQCIAYQPVHINKAEWVHQMDRRKTTFR